MFDSKKIAVIGDGTWATAIVHILSESRHDIKWWVRQADRVEHITKYRHNPAYLQSVTINLDIVTPTSDIQKVVAQSDYIILVVPAAYVADAISSLSADDLKGKKVITAIKGMIPENHSLVTDFITQNFNVPSKDLAIIAGPCHAEEIAMERQSYLTIGAEDLELAQDVANILKCRFVNVSVIDDLIGVEYAAIMKNVYALACGIAHGLNYGDNFQAVLVSNALQEISFFLNKVFPQERDLMRSAYLGDLMVTCYSQFSRNRTFGNMIGRGYSVRSAMVELEMVAEGYYATKSLQKFFNEKEIELPICKTVFNILYEKISPAIEMQLLKAILK